MTVVAGRQRDVSSKKFAETVPELGDELRTTFRNDLVGNTVETDDGGKEHVGGGFSVGRTKAGSKMAGFGEVVDENEDAVRTIGESGRSVIKSRPTELNGRERTGRGCKKPVSFCREALAQAQVSQEATYVLT